MSVLKGERLGEGLTASVPFVPIQGLFYFLSALWHEALGYVVQSEHYGWGLICT